MKSLKDTKHENFLRLFNKSKMSRQDLMAALDATKQYVSALIRNKAALGEEAVLKLAKIFSVDWIEFYRVEGKSHDALVSDWPDDLIELCKHAKEILDSDTIYADALRVNVAAFKDSIDLHRRLDNLEQTTSAGLPAGTGRRAASGIGKKRKAI
jgi:transcriptional regulator with XRE-family HTH domain